MKSTIIVNRIKDEQTCKTIKNIMATIKQIMDLNPTEEQIEGLLQGLRKYQIGSTY